MQESHLSTARPPAFGIAALLIFTVLLHAQALFHPFFLDDYVYLEKAHNFGWQKLVEILTTPALDQSASSVWWAPDGVLPFYRPMGQLTFVLDYFIWGLSPFGFHLTNVLLHVLCTFLTWRLGLSIFKNAHWALAAAAAFAIHPIHSEAVAWISGRFDSLVCACVLLSVLSYIRWAESKSRWQFGWLSLLWFALALGCKENALVLPAMIVVTEFFRRQRDRDNRRRVLPLFFGYGAIAGLYLGGRVLMFGSPLGKLPPPYGLSTSSPQAALAELAWNSAQYLLDIALCIPIEPAFLPLFWRDHWLLFALAVIASVALAVGVIYVARTRAAWVGLAWLIIFTAPALLSMPGERNIYLGTVGLAIVIGAAYGNMSARFAASTSAKSPLLWKRTAAVIIAIWFVLGAAQETMMGRIALAGEQLYQKIEVLLPEPAPNTHIFVVHHSPINSVGFPQALRLRYERPDLTGGALTLSPTLLSSATERILQTGPDTIRIERSGGLFFTSFVEQFHLFSQPVEMLGDLGGRFGLTLLNPPSTFEGLDTLEFRMPYNLDDPRLMIFYWDNHRVRKVRDLRRIGELTDLLRWVPRSE